MKVFLSWGGIRSKHIATTLHWWLPHIMQAVQPFLSEYDIPKGKRGIDVITQNLANSNVGIICLTPENLEKPWLNFEAGALSKLETAHVCTFLYDVKWTDVKPPLGDFQNTKNEEGDLLKLCFDINKLLATPLNETLVKEHFDMWYPQLKDRLTTKMPKADGEPSDKRDIESKFDEILSILRSSQDNTVIEEMRMRDMREAELRMRENEIRMREKDLHHELGRREQQVLILERELAERGPRLTRFVPDTGHSPDVPGFLRFFNEAGVAGSIAVDHCVNLDGFLHALNKKLIHVTPEGNVKLTDNGKEYMAKVLPTLPK